MSNHHLRNKNLSLKAKGLMSFMLSCNDNSTFCVAGLSTQCTDGETAVKSALKELKATGYITLHANKDDKGKITDWEYVLYESPLVENPQVENPLVENQPLLNTNSINGSKEPTINIKYSLNKEKEKEKEKWESFVDPSMHELWKRWLTHRSQSGKPYKSAVSMEAAYNKLMTLANGSVDIAGRIIMQSLENAWIGFFELKQNGTTTANNPTANARSTAATSAYYLEAKRRIAEEIRESLSGNDVGPDIRV